MSGEAESVPRTQPDLEIHADATRPSALRLHDATSARQPISETQGNSRNVP